MIPNALAIELTSMRIKKIGAIHLIITTNIFLDLNFSPFLVTSSITACGFITNPTKKQVSNAQIGINILLLIKSIMSKNDMFIQVINESGPKPRQDGVPSARENANTMIQALCLLHLNLSQKMETIVSINEIAEVKAAKNTRIKNIVPIKEPNFMLLKTFGSVTNMSPGPC